MSDQTGDYLKRAKAGDLRALAKLLTALEREGPACLKAHADLLRPPSAAFRLGVTGPPGAGKSTLIGQLITRLRAKKLRVGVLAVDPSSPFTQGAILGDRIRYTEHFADEGVFIRSLGSRGSLGGLSSSAYLMVRAFDVAAFDVVLLETVGVGQTELEIMNVADWVAVTLVPESGDSIQAMKAGLLEIANLFIVNKGDRPGADGFVRELEAALHLDPRASATPIPILKTTATSGDGLDELVAKIEAERSNSAWRTRRTSLDRMKAEAKSLLRSQAEREIETRLASVSNADEFARLF
ncbi:MAG: methylmalonyl Co-A mutase-associated GTPase MeaB [Bdellovibrionota bacterium]